MKLASLKGGGRDGTLIVVSRDLARARRVPEIAQSLQQALDDWARLAPKLATVARLLEEDAASDEFAFDPAACAAPLPRAHQWADGSAYVNHVELVRSARGAEMPQSFWTDPLMYQGGSDSMLGPADPIEAADEAHGIDFEGEVAVITDEVPMGVAPDEAAARIRLVMLVNDVSLRNLIPGELAKGFGFFQSKPSSAFSPVAVTPDELGADWREAKLHRPLTVHLNGQLFGRPDATSACECERSSDGTLAQCLHMLNSLELLGKVGGGRVKQLAADKRPHAERLRDLYLAALSREPTKEETAVLVAYIEGKEDVQAAYEDVVWAVINAKEFLFNH